MQDHTTPAHTRSHNTKGRQRRISAREKEMEKERGKEDRVDSYTLHIVLTLWAICQTEHIRKTNDLTGAVDSDNKAYNDYR